MTDREYQRLMEKVEATHDAVIDLRARFGPGPGEWASCVRHAEELAGQGRRLSGIERRVWLFAGGLAAAVFIAQLLADVALKFL